jgi:hypothetical protein
MRKHDFKFPAVAHSSRTTSYFLHAAAARHRSRSVSNFCSYTRRASCSAACCLACRAGVPASHAACCAGVSGVGFGSVKYDQTTHPIIINGMPNPSAMAATRSASIRLRPMPPPVECKSNNHRWCRSSQAATPFLISQFTRFSRIGTSFSNSAATVSIVGLDRENIRFPDGFSVLLRPTRLLPYRCAAVCQYGRARRTQLCLEVENTGK